MALFKDKFNNSYMKAATLGREITIYVENEADVPFWSKVFKRSDPGKPFRVWPASKEELKRGKQTVLTKAGEVGEFLLLAVDSDYDYLLQAYRISGRMICRNPYIFQTYTYSIENYKCLPESLEDLAVLASYSDFCPFDFTLWARDFSKIIYDFFIYNLLSEKKKDGLFTVEHFAKLLQFDRAPDMEKENLLDSLKEKIDSRLEEVGALYSPEDFNALKEDIERLGVTEDNGYLFVSGHIFYTLLG